MFCLFRKITGNHVNADVFVLSAGRHGAYKAYPEHQDTDKDITPYDPRIKKVSKENLCHGHADHEKQKSDQDYVFHTVKCCDRTTRYGFVMFSIRWHPLVSNGIQKYVFQ